MSHKIPPMRFRFRSLRVILAAVLLAGQSAELTAQAPLPQQDAWTANQVAPVAYQQLTPAAAQQTMAAATSMPLKPRAADSQGENERQPGGMQPLLTVGGSLAVVLGLFLLIVWALRRVSPGAAASLPGEVFEVLGRASLPSRQQVHLLRCGSKLLLVAVTAGGAETLTEITNADEVERIEALCRQSRRGSLAAGFRRATQEAEKPHE